MLECSVIEQVQLERGDLVLAEERRQRPTPQVPQQVEVLLALLLEGALDGYVDRSEEILPRPSDPVDLERQEAAGSITRHTGVKDQRLVSDQRHLAFPRQVGHVLPQHRAREERLGQGMHALFLRLAEHSGVLRVECREPRVEELILPAVNRNYPTNWIDS